MSHFKELFNHVNLSETVSILHGNVKKKVAKVEVSPSDRIFSLFDPTINSRFNFLTLAQYKWIVSICFMMVKLESCYV